MALASLCPPPLTQDWLSSSVQPVDHSLFVGFELLLVGLEQFLEKNNNSFYDTFIISKNNYQIMDLLDKNISFLLREKTTRVLLYHVLRFHSTGFTENEALCFRRTYCLLLYLILQNYGFDTISKSGCTNIGCGWYNPDQGRIVRILRIILLDYLNKITWFTAGILSSRKILAETSERSL